ncbi:peroxisome assembly protein 12 [Episyrphus balteatus]|uniref:peroxisome assembly protein 12 n=1 Tax=Episyrphus balteatus TaxID=286459 RepID=UPI0024862310|nr:peroxisome assembly protein 12 [Episyrphus balteatus]
MAEGANFAPNLQHTPSIFEVSASEVLDNLIYPAFSKIFDYFGLKLNIRINETAFSEDLSPVITFALQYFYLKQRGGSFGESFYGLQRTSALNGDLISNRKKFLSASLLTLLPYFERKLRQRSTQHESTEWEEYLIKAFHAYNAAKAVNTFLYLAKYSVSHSPILRFLGLTLRYPKDPPREDKASYMILKLLEVMAFFLQFIQWWYSNKQRQNIGGLQNPDAIRKSKLNEHQNPNGMCPICLMKISNPTACAVSGYVFCWKCIANHLKQRKKCPVSGYPIGIEDLVRIYEN